MKLLVENHGAAVDALSLAKKTALHMAAETGQMEVCNTLLKMNADANATDEVNREIVIPPGIYNEFQNFNIRKLKGDTCRNSCCWREQSKHEVSGG